MPNSITTYFTFSANTKARAAQVNNNFSNYRGDLLPIEEDTQAASDLSHDLGQPDHKWVEGYISTIFLGNTSTSWRVKDETTTVGDLSFLLNGTEKFRMYENQYTFGAAYISDSDAGSGQFILIGSTVTITTPSEYKPGIKVSFVSGFDTTLQGIIRINTVDTISTYQLDVLFDAAIVATTSLIAVGQTNLSDHTEHHNPVFYIKSDSYTIGTSYEVTLRVSLNDGNLSYNVTGRTMVEFLPYPVPV